MMMSSLFLLLLLASVAPGAATQHPILLIVADDLGYNDIGFQTPSFAVTKTPHLDFLAKGGIVFTNHHVQPFCSPTRAALQTGRHVLRYGLANTVIWPQDPWALPLNETFLSENLQRAGYYTAYMGKWVSVAPFLLHCSTTFRPARIPRTAMELLQHMGFFKSENLPMKRGFNEQVRASAAYYVKFDKLM